VLNDQMNAEGWTDCLRYFYYNSNLPYHTSLIISDWQGLALISWWRSYATARFTRLTCPWGPLQGQAIHHSFLPVLFYNGLKHQGRPPYCNNNWNKKVESSKSVFLKSPPPLQEVTKLLSSSLSIYSQDATQAAVLTS